MNRYGQDRAKDSSVDGDALSVRSYVGYDFRRNLNNVGARSLSTSSRARTYTHPDLRRRHALPHYQVHAFLQATKATIPQTTSVASASDPQFLKPHSSAPPSGLRCGSLTHVLPYLMQLLFSMAQLPSSRPFTSQNNHAWSFLALSLTQSSFLQVFVILAAVAPIAKIGCPSHTFDRTRARSRAD
ncbi:hypothetical protein B0H12DRAFT_1137338 [Mycena haematopus]|nr:hypothetical protein B0H12DRAFT_1137338 [Mycena haematopus]